jgi:phage terminase large subunit GpA-like protein
MTLSTKQIKNFINSVRLGLVGFFRPLPLTAVEWADANFYLSAESAYVEGRWETLPFQIAILNAMGCDEIRVVNLVKSARVGYSQMLKALVGYNLEHRKRNQLMFQPTDAAAAGFMKSHLETMIRDVPVVKALAPWEGKKHRDNTKDTKRFVNSKQLWCVGGTAAKNYREKSPDVVLYDELAAFPADVEKEGSPTFLGDKRIEGSIFPKSVRGSSPKIKGECQIERAASESDFNLRFNVPCPACREEQSLKWGGKKSDHGFKFNNQDPDGVLYACEYCGELAGYAEWMPQQKRGRWVCSDTGAWTRDGLEYFDAEDDKIAPPDNVTFWIWTAYSPFTTWARIVKDFLKAKDDPGKLKTFVNTTLGDTWEEDGERVDHDILYTRRENYPADVPAGGLVLTCAVDVQDDRLEAEVQAWGELEENWRIDFQVFHGDPGKNGIWADLDLYLQKTFMHENGHVLKIACTLIDSGGHYTQEVYRFVKKKAARRIFAIKGQGGVGVPIISRPSKSNLGKVKLFRVGVDTAKELVMARLGVLKPGPAYCHFPISYKFDEEYFLQLTAEERRTRFVKGFAVKEWHKTRKRNEAFDLAVYNLAARELLNPNYAALAKKMALVVDTETTLEKMRPAFTKSETKKEKPKQKPKPKQRRRAKMRLNF